MSKEPTIHTGAHMFSSTRFKIDDFVTYLKAEAQIAERQVESLCAYLALTCIHNHIDLGIIDRSISFLSPDFLTAA